MKKQLLSILGLYVFSVTLLTVSASDCFAQGALPATEDDEAAADSNLWITLSDRSRLMGELDPMTTFRLTSDAGERVFYPNDFLLITLDHSTGVATVRFINGDTLTGELEFDDYLAVETTWGGQVDIECESIASILNYDPPAGSRYRAMEELLMRHMDELLEQELREHQNRTERTSEQD